MGDKGETLQTQMHKMPCGRFADRMAFCVRNLLRFTSARHRFLFLCRGQIFMVEYICGKELEKRIKNG